MAKKVLTLIKLQIPAGAANPAPPVDKGSGEPNREKVGRLTAAQCREIAERKMPDLNANDLDAASKIIAGTARSMGVTVEGVDA